MTTALVIGRSKDCDISVDDPNVSVGTPRSDARTAYWIVDLGSTNGITVNGKRGAGRLSPEDEIFLGTTEVRFERGY